jgi:hypothetical protein
MNSQQAAGHPGGQPFIGVAPSGQQMNKMPINNQINSNQQQVPPNIVQNTGNVPPPPPPQHQQATGLNDNQINNQPNLQRH